MAYGIKVVQAQNLKEEGKFYIGYVFVGRAPRVTPTVKRGIEKALMRRFGLEPNKWKVQTHYRGKHVYYDGQRGYFINFIRRGKWDFEDYEAEDIFSAI